MTQRGVCQKHTIDGIGQQLETCGVVGAGTQGPCPSALLTRGAGCCMAERLSLGCCSGPLLQGPSGFPAAGRQGPHIAKTVMLYKKSFSRQVVGYVSVSTLEMQQPTAICVCSKGAATPNEELRSPAETAPLQAPLGLMNPR